MGCGASRSQGRAPPPGKRLEEWDQKEVEHWFSSIPRVSQYRSLILPDDGFVVATWDKQLLVRKGVPEDDADRIIGYRDRALHVEGTGNVVEPNGKQTTRESLLALAKKGLTFARMAVENLGPLLPPPGAQAADMLLQVLNAVDTAVVTSDGVVALRDRALAIMDILDAYRERLKGLKGYTEVVGRYTELLQGVRTFAQTYASRNCLSRLATAFSDKGDYESLASRMADTGEALMTLLAADTNAAVAEACTLLRQMAQYKVWGTHLPKRGEMAEELGGIKAVEADEGKLQAVFEKLDIGPRITISVVKSVLQSYMDEGPHKQIRQPDLRLLWMTHYRGLEKVSWSNFWRKFLELPDTLKDELRAVLTDEDAKVTFQRAVGKPNKDTVSVWDLDDAFNGDEGLLQQVQSLLCGLKAQLPPLYLGRDEEAAAVVEHLRTRGSLVLVAPGGMGKSSLAADVGLRLLRQQGGVAGGVLRVDLREATTAAEVQARFCAKLGLELDKKALDGITRIVAALKQLATARTAGKLAVLVMVDNAEDALQQQDAARALRSLVGKVLTEAPAARLLITSRQPLDSEDLTLDKRDVGTLGLDAARQVIQKAATNLTDTQAAALAEACRCVPLIVCLVAKALSVERIALEDVIRLHSQADVASSTADVVRVVLKSLPRSQQLAMFKLAIFPTTFHEDVAAKVLQMSEPAVRGMCAVLYSHSLLQRAGPQRHVVHTEVRQAATMLGGRDDTSSLQQRFVGVFLDYLHDWSGMYDSATGWQRALDAARDHTADITCACELLRDVGRRITLGFKFPGSVRRLLSAACLVERLQGPCSSLLATLESSEPTTGEDAQKTVATLQLLLAWALLHLGKYKDAQMLAQQSWDKRVRVLGTENQGTLEARNTLAACMVGSGQYKDAESLFREVWEAQRRVLGAEHPDTLESLSDLSVCITECGRYEEAELKCKEVLEARRRVLGPEHPGTLDSLNNLAVCMKACGRYAEAEDLYQQVLEARKRVLGAEHPDTLTALGNLAVCVRRRGRHKEAEDLYQQVLAGRHKVQGAEHPDTLASLNNLAVCYNAFGRHAEAEALYRQVLEARERVLGAEHPDTLGSRSGLASCKSACGHYKEAKDLHQDVVEARARVLGAEHPETLASRNDVVVCIMQCGNCAEAEGLCREVLAARQRTLGAEHPDTLTSMNTLAVCTKRLGRPTQAAGLYRDVLEAMTRLLGAEHPSTLTSQNDLAGCMAACDRLADAEDLYRQVLEARQRALGADHQDTLTTRNDLAVCVRRQGRHTEAEDLYRQVLEARERMLGAEHPHTLASLSNLAVCISTRGGQAEAEDLYRQVLEARRKVLGAEHPDTLASLRNLSNCIRRAGRRADADALLREFAAEHLGP